MFTVRCGTALFETALIICEPALMMPSCSYSVPTMYPVNIGASYGAGNYGMCGRAYSPRFLWAWPSAKTSIMGAEQLSSVMEAVGKKVDPDLKARIERESEVTFATARLWDDGVIPPSHTRRVLGMGLQAALGGSVEDKKTEFGVFRM